MEEVYSTGSAFAAVLQNRTVITFGNPDGGMKFEPIEPIEPGAPEDHRFSIFHPAEGAIFLAPLAAGGGLHSCPRAAERCARRCLNGELLGGLGCCLVVSEEAHDYGSKAWYKKYFGHLWPMDPHMAIRALVFG